MTINRQMRRCLIVLLAAALVLLVSWGAKADSASAKAAVLSFSNTPSTTQAGGHPDIVTSFELGHRLNQGPIPPCACNELRDVTVHAPAGVIANPHVVSECAPADLATISCPPEAQVGFVIVKFLGFWTVHPLYRTTPQAGQAALFGFIAPISTIIPQYISVNARTGGDYGLDVKQVGVFHAIWIDSVTTVFWGVPGDPAHDPVRFPKGAAFADCGSGDPVPRLLKNELPPEECGATGYTPTVGASSSLPVAPFTQNPTTCVGPQTTVIETVAYDRETDSADAPWPATTGCDLLSFNPSLSAAPTTKETDAPSGLGVDLRVPQFQDPNTPSPSAIRGATLTLPEGFSINPNAADGKVSCSDAEAGFGTEEPSRCPEFAKIGTTLIDSAALPAPISGYAYLGDPKPGDRYRIILTAGGFGTFVKIAGSIRPDPETGRVVTVFESLPQAPFQRFLLHLFGSERGVLATPEKCGRYAVRAVFVPWAAELSRQSTTQFFDLDSGPGGRSCPAGARPFDPKLQVGVADNTAAVHSPFVLRLGRADGDQYLTGLTVKTPPGFSAALRGIPYCPEAAIAQLQSSTYSGRLEQLLPACSSASQVGTVLASAGSGSRPVNVSGRAYLAGPYKGAPLSLLVVVPAVSGPYDLGNVTTRVALHVHPVSAQVTAVSDPLPKIVDGIPLRTRVIQIELDRPGFALNPTNCDRFSVDATISGDEGAVSDPSGHFQVANCADLRFGPKLSLRLTGGLKRRGHPAIHAVLRARPGEANIRRVAVTLPEGELLDNSHIGSVCTRVQFSNQSCPAGSLLGTAEAVTPLLDKPLRGKVYLRSSTNQLPDLAIDLKGQIDIELAGRIDSVNGRLRTTFEAIPDAPVTAFRLHLAGGSKGLLINSKSLCGAPKRAAVRMRGQNGRSFNRKVRLQTNCASAKRSNGHKRQAKERAAR